MGSLSVLETDQKKIHVLSLLFLKFSTRDEQGGEKDYTTFSILDYLKHFTALGGGSQSGSAAGHLV